MLRLTVVMQQPSRPAVNRQTSRQTKHLL